MKIADMHPAIIALNERLILSHLEFLNAGIRPYSYAWQNFSRLAWMSAARLRNARGRRIKQRLQALPAEAVIDRITGDDIRAMIAEEHAYAKEIVGNDYDLVEQGGESMEIAGLPDVLFGDAKIVVQEQLEDLSEIDVLEQLYGNKDV
jgi:hypothetical protein